MFPEIIKPYQNIEIKVQMIALSALQACKCLHCICFLYNAKKL